MVDVTTSTVAMAFAVVGVVATLGWYVLAWYSIRTLQDLREAV